MLAYANKRDRESAHRHRRQYVQLMQTASHTQTSHRTYVEYQMVVCIMWASHVLNRSAVDVTLYLKFGAQTDKTTATIHYSDISNIWVCSYSIGSCSQYNIYLHRSGLMAVCFCLARWLCVVVQFVHMQKHIWISCRCFCIRWFTKPKNRRNELIIVENFERNCFENITTFHNAVIEWLFLGNFVRIFRIHKLPKTK